LTDVDICNYQNIYYRSAQDETNPLATRKLGWFTSTITRRTMLDTFYSWFIEDEIKIYDPELLSQMLRFVRDASGKPAAQGLELDDRVLAAALTIQASISQPKVSDFMDRESMMEISKREAQEKYKRMLESGLPCVMVAPTESEIDHDLYEEQDFIS